MAVSSEWALGFGWVSYPRRKNTTQNWGDLQEEVSAQRKQGSSLESVFPFQDHTPHTILPGCFWCDALIFIHGRKIYISNPHFCGNFYFQLQQNTIENSSEHSTYTNYGQIHCRCFSSSLFSKEGLMTKPRSEPNLHRRIYSNLPSGKAPAPVSDPEPPLPPCTSSQLCRHQLLRHAGISCPWESCF